MVELEVAIVAEADQADQAEVGLMEDRDINLAVVVEEAVQVVEEFGEEVAVQVDIVVDMVVLMEVEEEVILIKVEMAALMVAEVDQVVKTIQEEEELTEAMAVIIHY